MARPATPQSSASTTRLPRRELPWALRAPRQRTARRPMPLPSGWDATAPTSYHVPDPPVESPGWVLVCSDGLWNYASEATALQSLVAELSTPDSDPLTLAVALVDWANSQVARTTSRWRWRVSDVRLGCLVCPRHTERPARIRKEVDHGRVHRRGVPERVPARRWD